MYLDVLLMDIIVVGEKNGARSPCGYGTVFHEHIMFVHVRANAFYYNDIAAVVVPV